MFPLTTADHETIARLSIIAEQVRDGFTVISGPLAVERDDLEWLLAATREIADELHYVIERERDDDVQQQGA